MLNVAGQFGVVDFIVFSASLAVSVGIGIYCAYADRNETSASTYMFGNKKMSALPVSLSMAVTFVSALTVLSMPTEIYLYGAVFIWTVVGSNLGIMVAVIYFVPLYCKLRINTLFEMFYMGVASYIPALAISAVTPLSLEVSILTTVSICTIYTTLGGIKAVIWTDVVQGLIMLLGCISLVIKVAAHVGGMGNIWEATVRGERNNFFVFTSDPRVRSNVPALNVGYFMFGFSTTAASQTMVQRYISCGRESVAKKACYLKMLPMSMFSIIAVLTGLSCYAYYEECDPKLSGSIEKYDQTIPLLVVTIFKDIPGFAGIFVAAAFCGTLSTVSSGLNSMATVFVNDFVLSLRPNTTEKTQLILTKTTSFIIGVCVWLVAWLCTVFKGTVIRLVFATVSAQAGLTLAMFMYMFMPMVSTKGAIGSLMVGLSFSWFLAIGALTTTLDPSITRKLHLTTSGCDNFNITTTLFLNSSKDLTTTMIETTKASRGVLEDTLFSLSPYLYSITTLSVTMISGILISLITGPAKSSDMNPELFIPLITNKRYPKSVLKFFRFGVPELSENKNNLQESEEVLQLNKFTNEKC